MDELASTVDSLFTLDDPFYSSHISTNYVTYNPASNKHPRLDAYKNNAVFHSSQAERRQNLLFEQKK